MAEAAPILWVAQVVLTRRRAEWALTMVSALGIICITMLALATAAVPVAVAHQEQRADALAPRLDRGSDATDPAELRVVPPEITNNRRWQGRRIVRDYYVKGTSVLTPPGIASTPRAGQYYASPDLTRLIRTDPTVAALFAGLQPLGAIEVSGLVQPHELRAIVGADPASRLLIAVNGFGGSQPTTTPQEQRDNSRLAKVVAFFVGAMVWVPAGTFIVIVARLSAGQRHRRARALRLVGLSNAAVRAVHAAEMALTSVPAALLAALAYVAARQQVDEIPGTGLGFFPADAQLPWWLFALAATLPALVACAVTAFSLSTDVEKPESGTRQRRPHANRYGALAVLAGALMLGVGPLVEPVLGVLSAVGLWVGCALVAVGLGLSGPTIVIAVFKRAALGTRSGGRLVGTRLATNTVSTSLRLGSLLAVIVLMLLGGAAFTSVLNGGRSEDWQSRLANQSLVPTIVTDLAGELSLSEMRVRAPGTPIVQQVEVQAGRLQLSIVYADCADLRELAGRRPSRCSGRPQWLDAAPQLPTGIREIHLPSGEELPLPVPLDRTVVDRAPSSFATALLLPARMAPASSGSGSTYFMLARNTELMKALAQIAGAAPAVQFDLGDLDNHNPDIQRFPTQIRWLTIGAGTSLLVGVLALLATAVGETRERSMRLRTLRVLGAPNRELLYAHLWSTSGPLAILGLTATALGWLSVRAMHNLDDRASVGGALLPGTALGAVIVAVLVGLLTWPGVLWQAPKSGGVRG